MKCKITKTIASIVFVVFLGICCLENVDAKASYHGNVDRTWNPADEDYKLSSHMEGGTVCKYSGSGETAIVEINNSGIGIKIKYGTLKGKFLRNWEHNNERDDYGLIRGVDYYEANEKDCPEYIVVCSWGKVAGLYQWTPNHYYVAKYNPDRQKEACSDEANLSGDSQYHLSLIGIYQVPHQLPPEMVIEDTPDYFCEEVNGKFYDIGGRETDEETYKESCASAGMREGQVSPLSPNNATYSCGNGYLTDIPGSLLRFSRIFYVILQILVPIALVIMGSLDLLKAVAAQKEDEIKKGQSLFFKRLISAIAVFFVFAIIKFMVSIISDQSDSVIDCVTCFVEGTSSSSCV